MTKGIVIAASPHQYRKLLDMMEASPKDYPMIKSGIELHGLHPDTLVLLLEGYQLNRRYTVNFMEFVGHRFTNINFIPELVIKGGIII